MELYEPLLASGEQSPRSTTGQPVSHQNSYLYIPDNAGEIDCSVPSAPASDSVAPVQPGPVSNCPATETDLEVGDIVIPISWVRMVEHQFAGKEFGVSGFGVELKASLLLQMAHVNRALVSVYDAKKRKRNRLKVDQIYEIVDACDPSGSPEKTRPYVHQLVIATAREDIGRAYLKALQAHGQMLGTSYDAQVAALADQITVQLPEEAVEQEHAA